MYRKIILSQNKIKKQFGAQIVFLEKIIRTNLLG